MESKRIKTIAIQQDQSNNDHDIKGSPSLSDTEFIDQLMQLFLHKHLHSNQCAANSVVQFHALAFIHNRSDRPLLALFQFELVEFHMQQPTIKHVNSFLNQSLIGTSCGKARLQQIMILQLATVMTDNKSNSSNNSKDNKNISEFTIISDWNRVLSDSKLKRSINPDYLKSIEVRQTYRIFYHANGPSIFNGLRVDLSRKVQNTSNINSKPVLPRLGDVHAQVFVHSFVGKLVQSEIFYLLPIRCPNTTDDSTTYDSTTDNNTEILDRYESFLSEGGTLLQLNVTEQHFVNGIYQNTDSKFNEDFYDVIIDGSNVLRRLKHRARFLPASDSLADLADFLMEGNLEQFETPIPVCDIGRGFGSIVQPFRLFCDFKESFKWWIDHTYLQSLRYYVYRQPEFKYPRLPQKNEPVDQKDQSEEQQKQPKQDKEQIDKEQKSDRINQELNVLHPQTDQTDQMDLIHETMDQNDESGDDESDADESDESDGQDDKINDPLQLYHIWTSYGLGRTNIYRPNINHSNDAFEELKTFVDWYNLNHHSMNDPICFQAQNVRELRSSLILNAYHNHFVLSEPVFNWFMQDKTLPMVLCQLIVSYLYL